MNTNETTKMTVTEVTNMSAEHPEMGWDDPAILREDTKKAKAHSKEFIKNNRTRKIVISSNAMNEYDEKDGKWKTIDNTLVEKEDEYESRLGKFKAKIKKSEKRRGVEVVGDGMMLSWEFLGREKDGEKNEDNEKHEKKKSSLKVTPKKKNFARGNVESNARYENCEDNLDIEYVLQSNNIKENIIIRKKENSYRYRFAFSLEGLTMRLAEDQSSLEIFSCAADENGVPCEKREFTIPAPFMFDKAGARSDEVQFELEETDAGKYTFTVVANENWINDPSRTFPVTIDPQIKIDNFSFVSIAHIVTTGIDSSGGGSGSGSGSGSDDGESELVENVANMQVMRSTSSTIQTRLRLHKSTIKSEFPENILTSKILGIYLILTSQQNLDPEDLNDFMLNGYKPEYVDTTHVRFNILPSYKSSSGPIDLFLKPTSNISSHFFELEAALEIDYITYTYDRPTKKEFSLVGGAKCVVDLHNKSNIITFPATSGNNGLAIEQIHKDSKNSSIFGKNFHLSLDEKLLKDKADTNEVDYVYTDAHGDVHLFKEVFYYIDKSGTKVMVDKHTVSVDTDGSLSVSVPENGVETRYDVVKDNVSDSAWVAVTQLDGVENIELLEQRSDDEKQLEKQVIAYEDTLKSFVIVDEETGKEEKSIKDMCESASEKSLSEVLAEAENFTNPPNGKLVITESDFINFKSAIEQKASLEFQKESLEKQKTTLQEQQEALERQKKSIVLQLYNVLNTPTEGIAYKNDKWNSANKLETLTNLYLQFKEIGSINDTSSPISTQILNTIPVPEDVNIPDIVVADWNHLQELDNSTDPSLTINTTSIAALNEQIESIETQKELITKQIDIYIESIEQHKTQKSPETFAKYHKEYVNLKAQLDAMHRHTPVNYLRKDGVIKGFNADGDLVVIFDGYGNYYAINYDTRIINGTERIFITGITDNNERTTTFNYDTNLLLTSIVTPNGERTAYTYDNGLLKTITYPNGKTLTLEYGLNNRISTITSSDLTYSNITRFTTTVEKIENYSDVQYISHNSHSGSDMPISSYTFEYNETAVEDKTTVTDQNGNQEIYVFEPDQDILKMKFTVENNKVAGAELYEYVQDEYEVVKYADETTLNSKPYTSFVFDPDLRVYTEFDAYRRTAVEKSEWLISGSGYTKPVVEKTFTYDEAHRLIKTVNASTELKNNYPKTTTVVSTYQYNDKGSLIRKESYVEGKQLTEGIVVEEHEYDDKGREVKTITYNTLDASSKFYTEKEYDEDGNLIAEPDATGEHKTSYNYSANDGSLRSELLPNGSKFAYGYDTAGNLTTVSQSTEDGEENCNNTVYTYDVPTEVTSGNNTVRYTYDGKRRIKSVELNGAKDYVTYNYTDATADTPESTVTTVLGDPSSTCSITTTVTQNSRDNNKTITQRTKKLNVNGALVDTIQTISLGYDTRNRLTSISGRSDNKNETFTYNTLDKLESYTYTDGNDDIVKETYHYDTDHQLVSKSIAANNTTKTYTYSYKDDTAKSLDSITLGSFKFTPKTDCLGRNRGKTISVSNSKIAEEQITYLKFGDHATNIPATIYYGDKKNGNYSFSDHFKYKYDSMGNIAEVRENGELYAKYAYDTIGRLVREDNKKLGKTNVYTYDTNGNILCRKEYTFTLTDKLDELPSTVFAYTYDGDKMLSYNGEACVYDTIGNPTTYCNKTLTWANGRQLSSYDNTTFTYDNLGRRTAKNGTSFTYDSSGNLIHQSNGISFIYDTSGVCGLIHSGATYFYRKDILGNIIALLDTDGEIVATYTYDAWGKHTITDANGNVITTTNNIALLNPFRYRGYYFDTETSLYFLKTRYYDPEMGRFITIDDISYLDPDSINGLNLYAYCRNNPVMYSDPTGNILLITSLVLGLIGTLAVGGGVISGVKAYNEGARGWDLVKSTLSGVAIGLLIGGGLVVTTAVLMGAVGITTILGASVASIFAIGALAVDTAVFFILPFFDIKMEGIEYDTSSIPNIQPPIFRSMQLFSKKNNNLNQSLSANSFQSR